MAFTRPALNPREPIADKGGFPTLTFLIYNRDLRADVAAAPTGFNPVLLQTQTAAIGTTAIPVSATGVSTLKQGLYRVTSSARITQVATANSSVTLTIGWTDGGVACSQTFADMTGNLTTTTQGNVFALTLDAGASITYAVAYVSNVAASAQYALTIAVEEVPL